MVVYTLTIVAFHTTLTIPEVMNAEAVAVTFAEKLYGNMAWIVPVFVAMSTFGECSVLGLASGNKIDILKSKYSLDFARFMKFVFISKLRNFRLPGGVNGILFTSSRLFFAGAEHNQMPRLLCMIQTGHLTPTPAVITMVSMVVHQCRFESAIWESVLIAG